MLISDWLKLRVFLTLWAVNNEKSCKLTVWMTSVCKLRVTATVGGSKVTSTLGQRACRSNR